MDWEDARLRETMHLPRPAEAADAEQIANHYREFEPLGQRRIGALAAEEFVATVVQRLAGTCSARSSSSR
jgi:hypothetical protein